MFLEYTSLIIPTKDRPNRLGKLFESMENFISYINEIIIVDSSNKENFEFTKKFISKFKNVKLLESVPSTSKQRNLGIENYNKKNKFIMFCDDDITFEKNSINIISEFIYSNKNYLGYGFNLIEDYKESFFDNLKKHKFLEQVGLYNSKPGVVCENGWHTKNCNLVKNLETSWLSTQACIYRTSVFKDSKFDTTLGKYSYLEDLFFSYNVFKKGKLYICSKAKYNHKNSINRTNFSFGVQEVINRHKFVKMNNFNIKKFYLSMLIKTILSLINVFIGRIYYFPKFLGNFLGIFLCISKK
mgnify:CR=1 FL=1